MTLTYAIKEGLTYERRTAKGTQSPLQTLASRRGSCRDFATLDDGGGARAGLRRPLRLRLSLCARSRRRRDAISAAARRMRGARSICPAPAGSNSIRPMASSAAGTSFASRSRARRVRPFPFMGRYFGDAADDDGNGRSPSMFDGSRKAAPLATDDRNRSTHDGMFRQGASLERVMRADATLGRRKHEDRQMLIQAGFDIAFECPAQTPMLLQLNVHPSREADLLSPDIITSDPPSADARLSRSFRQSRHASRSPAGPGHLLQSLRDP